MLLTPIANPLSEDHADGKAESGCQGEDAAEEEREFPHLISVGVRLCICRRSTYPEGRQHQWHGHDPPTSDKRADGDRDEGGDDDFQHAGTYTGPLRV